MYVFKTNKVELSMHRRTRKRRRGRNHQLSIKLNCPTWIVQLGSGIHGYGDVGHVEYRLG